jgi:hypothetical protein
VGTYIDRPLYHYYQRDTAISKTKELSIKSDILKVYKYVERMLNEYGFPDISFWARGFYCYHAGAIAEIALDNRDAETLTNMQSQIYDHIDDYIESNREHPEKYERMLKILNAKLGEDINRGETKR